MNKSQNKTKTKIATKIAKWLINKRRFKYMKATGIVRRIDDLGRVVIPKEIRRTMRIREGDPLLTTLTVFDRFCVAIFDLNKRIEVLKGNTYKK